MPKILIVTANSKTTPLQLAAEIRGIRESLGEWSNFRVSSESEIRIQDLLRRLLEERPDILHFAGHGAGGADQVLAVMADNGQQAILTKRDLGDIFQNLPVRPKLIVLNACFSSELSNELTKWTDAVVGADDAIGDDSARRFAASFYRALGQACSVKAAFTLAKTEIRVAGYDSSALVLSHREELDPSKLVFYSQPELMAKLVLTKSGKPEVSVGHYHMYLWLRGVDQSVEAATFQVCHSSFTRKERFWEVSRSESATFLTDNFRTRGDVTIRATAWSRERGVGVETTLGAALRRFYGTQIDPAMLTEIEIIEEA